MGERLDPQQFGSFSEARLRGAGKLRGSADRAKPRPGRKETTPKKPPETSASASGGKPPGKSTRKKQTPAQRRASLQNLAKARAARAG